MKSFVILGFLLLLALTPAVAEPSLPPAPKAEASLPPAPKAPPQPDLDKPITTTLRKVQAVVAAQVAQALAQQAAQAAQADLADMIKQATPPKP